MEKLSCAQAKQIDLVTYLALLGHYSQQVRNQDHWFISPLREEKTPSFKVNRQLNLWYDHGNGKGGNLIDFGVLYFNCTVTELLKHLSSSQVPNFSFQPLSSDCKNNDTHRSKILIFGKRRLAAKRLLEYLQKRCIPSEIAERFCQEIDFELYGRKYYAIGFQNNAGGYEIRNPNFKGSSSPKDISIIDNGKDQLVVFEGFFSYLSFQTIHQHKNIDLTNFLVLNSLSFFEKNREIMEQYQRINLFLDRDEPGLNSTKEALEWSDKYIDASHKYKGFKDLNEFHIHSIEINLKEGWSYHGRL
jgi:Toprim-like/CHC2 zinc finger